MEYTPPSGTITYPTITCNLHFDDKTQDRAFWPQALCCKPEPGEIIRGMNGRRGIIESVQHSFYSAIKIEDGKSLQVQYPCLVVKVRVTAPGDPAA